MTKYLYIFEKPSARREGVKALGGDSGVFEGEEYATVNLIGHILQGYKPEEQAKDSYKETVGGFGNVAGIPWSPEYFDFRKRQPSESLGDTAGKILKTIQGYLNAGYVPVIATDLDPSCEGDAVGHEVLDYLGYTGPRYREYHLDESIKEFQKAFREKKLLTDDDARKRKAYFRADADYMSQQLTRVATIEVQRKGYKLPKPVDVGRLKSRILDILGEQIKKVAEYKPSSVYESRYKLDNLILTNKEVKQFQTEAEWDPEGLPLEAKVREVGQVPGVTVPPKALTFNQLSGLMSKQGMSLGTTEKLYQAMYEADGDGKGNGYVTYPRTEDNFISPEQFKEITPLLDDILNVIGLPSAAFTHRSPRPTHVKTGGAHGANRPGLAVPKSLEDLDVKFGKGAGAIYKAVASRFVMMYLEDTEWIRHDYKTVGTEVPFTGSVKIITKQGVTDPDEDKSDVATSLPDLSKLAKLYAHEVKSTKPASPTTAWVVKQMAKEYVGTPATQPHTLKDMIGKATNKPIKDGKVLSLSPIGKVGYAVAHISEIGSLYGTKTIPKLMDDVYKGVKTSAEALKAFNDLLARDVEAIRSTTFNLDELGLEKQVVKEKAKGTWYGYEIEFNRVYAEHRFTDEEVEKLLAGDEIEIDGKTKEGKDVKLRGKLEEQEFKGAVFYGFKGSIVRTDQIEGVWNGKKIAFKNSFGGHIFTADEIEKLLNGESIEITCLSTKTGKEFKMRGGLAEQEFKGKPFVGFKGDIVREGYVDGVWNGKKVSIKGAFAGHTFTASELDTLFADGVIEFKGTTKAGKEMDFKGKLEEYDYQGRMMVGFKPIFEVKEREGYASGEWNGKRVQFKASFMGHEFSEDEIAQLLAGKKITFTGTTKGGKEMMVGGGLAVQTYEGRKFVGFKAEFDNKKGKGDGAL